MFSNYSEMKVYEEDPKYQATKSYSKEDMKRFREEAAHDGFRIQELISSLPHGTGAAIQHLLRNDQLAPEELLGIEHFIVKRDTALKMAYARKVHVAFVLDVQMPGLDGIATLREIKQLAPLIEVIMLTGHATVQTAIDGMKLGAYDYIMKPVENENLVDKITKAYTRKMDQEERIRQAEIESIVKTKGW